MKSKKSIAQMEYNSVFKQLSEMSFDGIEKVLEVQRAAYKKATARQGGRMEETVEVDMELIYETEDAYLFSGGDEKYWIPKSLVHEKPEMGDMGTVVIPEWLAIERGMI